MSSFPKAFMAPPVGGNNFGIILPDLYGWLATARGRRPRAVLKTEGTVFPNTDRPRLVNNTFIFFLNSPCIRRELLKFKLTNQNSASGENCAIRRYIKNFHSDCLDRWTFAQCSLIYGFLSHERRERENMHRFVSLLLTIDLSIQFL